MRLGVELDGYTNIMKGIKPNYPDSSHYYTIIQLGGMPPPQSTGQRVMAGQLDTI